MCSLAYFQEFCHSNLTPMGVFVFVFLLQPCFHYRLTCVINRELQFYLHVHNCDLMNCVSLSYSLCTFTLVALACYMQLTLLLLKKEEEEDCTAV